MADNKISNHDYRRDTSRPAERDSLNRGGRIITPQRIPEKSPFAKLLDNNQQSLDYSSDDPGARQSSSAPLTREAVKPAASQQERYGHEKENFEKRLQEREKDREEGKSSGPLSDSSGLRGKQAEKKVIGRGSASEQKGQGRGEGHGGGRPGSDSQGQGKRGKGSPFLPTMRAEKSVRRGSLTEAKGTRFQLEASLGVTRTNPLAKQAKAQPPLNKALLDQIVQYCRLVTKTDGDKELDMQLHEEVFKGLKLRVTMVKGKLDATFTTSNESVRDLFQGQKAEIQKALSEKGIDVRLINVIMI